MFCGWCMESLSPWSQSYREKKKRDERERKKLQCQTDLLRQVMSRQSRDNKLVRSIQNLHTGKREFTFKILLLGGRGSGKTSFIKRYVHRYYSNTYRPTNGVDFTLKNISWNKYTQIKLQLWDVPGTLQTVSPHILEGAVGAVILLDLTSPGGEMEALDLTKDYRNQLDDKVRLLNGSPVPAVLVAHKADEDGKRVADTERMRRICREFGMVAWFQVSSRDNIQVKESVNFLLRHVLEEQIQVEEMMAQVDRTIISDDSHIVTSHIDSHISHIDSHISHIDPHISHTDPHISHTGPSQTISDPDMSIQVNSTNNYLNTHQSSHIAADHSHLDLNDSHLDRSWVHVVRKQGPGGTDKMSQWQEVDLITRCTADIDDDDDDGSTHLVTNNSDDSTDAVTNDCDDNNDVLPKSVDGVEDDGKDEASRATAEEISTALAAYLSSSVNGSIGRRRVKVKGIDLSEYKLEWNREVNGEDEVTREEKKDVMRDEDEVKREEEDVTGKEDKMGSDCGSCTDSGLETASVHTSSSSWIRKRDEDVEDVAQV